MNFDDKIPVTTLVSILHTGASCEESLYRTRWLMAHNRLHALAHGEEVGSAQDAWNEYLTELETSEEVARPAA